MSSAGPTTTYGPAIGCALVSLGALAAIVPLADAAPATVPGPGQAAWWATLVGLLAQCAALCWVRARPRAVLVLVAVPAPVLALAGAGDATSLTSLALVVAAYVAGTSRSLTDLAPALAAAAALMAAGSVVSAVDLDVPLSRAVATALLQAVGTLGLVLLVASWVRALRESRQARAEQGRALAREQSALVQAAIARERTDMARELHDIAAHHLTGIAITASVVERQIETDPAGARQAVQQVRHQSTMVLRDLRSLVGLLRDQDPAARARPETLAGIHDLVAEVAGSGRDVSYAAHGEDPGREVGPLAQLAAYRAVQEALANAGRHAPGARCEVTVDARPADAVVVTVRNAPAADTTPTGPTGPTGGFGLVGMRERAQLTGAALDVGPTADGGWRVTLRVPKEATEGEAP